MVALVVKPVQLLGQALGIIEAKDTGCALADMTGRTLAPVPPVTIPSSAKKSWKAGILS